MLIAYELCSFESILILLENIYSTVSLLINDNMNNEYMCRYMQFYRAIPKLKIYDIIYGSDIAGVRHFDF